MQDRGAGRERRTARNRRTPRDKWALLVLVAVILLTAALYRYTGPEYSLLPFSVLAVLWAVSHFRLAGGLAVAAVTAASWYGLNDHPSGLTPAWNALARFAVMALFAYVAALRQAVSEALANTERLAAHDPLTGVLNIRAFSEILHEQIERCRRSGMPLSLAFVDLDRFKEVNDRLGHTAGDAVLTLAAGTLARALRSTDLLARVGGDEFVALLPGAASEEASFVAHRLRSGVAEAMSHAGWPVTASVGLVTWSTLPADADHLVSRADSAMYAAKRGGGNRVEHLTILADEDDAAAKSPPPPSA